MPTELLILAALPWLLILLTQILRRPFVVLMAWLFLAPIFTNWFERSAAIPIVTTQGHVKGRVAVYREPTQVTPAKLIKPTRTLIVLLVLVLLSTNKLLNKAPRISFDQTEIRMGIFSLILLMNAILWAGRPAYALHTATDAFIVSFLAYYCARQLVTDTKRFDQLTRVIVYVGAYVIVLCLIERLTSPGLFRRTIGPFESANTTYAVLVVAFYTAMSYLLPAGGDYRLIRRPPRVLAWFVACLAPVVIALTTVRGNYVGFLASLWVFLLLARRLTNLAQQSRAIGLALLLIPLLVLTLQGIVPKEFFEERVGNTANILGRVATWLAILRVVAEAPVFGIGLNNMFAFLVDRATTFGGVGNLRGTHNSLLAIFAELGTVGLIVYVAVIVSIIKTGLNSYRTDGPLDTRWRGAVLVSIIVGYLAPSLFANTLYSTGLLHLYVYTMAGAIAGLHGKQPLRFQSAIDKRFVYRPQTADSVPS